MWTTVRLVVPLLNLAFQPLLRCVLEYCVFSTNYTRQLWQAFVAGNLEAAGFDAASSVSLAYVMKEVDALISRERLLVCSALLGMMGC